MLEERNRIMVDSIASLLFAYTDYEADYLRSSSELRGQVFVEGNTTIDVMNDFALRIDEAAGVPSGRYVYVTMHRKEFTDSVQRMTVVFSELARIAEKICPVIFPLHPRTRDAMRRHGIQSGLLGGVQVTQPVSVFESLSLQKRAAAVLTDSGCIQEEAYMLGRPCVTIRDNTERHLSVTNKANVVSGFAPSEIRRCVEWALGITKQTWPEIYGSPGVGSRIIHRVLTCEGVAANVQRRSDSGHAKPRANTPSIVLNTALQQHKA